MLDRLGEARREIDLAVEIAGRTLRPRHPNLALLRLTSGGIAVVEGRPRAALREAQWSKRVLEIASGPDHPHVAEAHWIIGAAYGRLNRPKLARSHRRKAQLLFEVRGLPKKRLAYHIPEAVRSDLRVAGMIHPSS
jgi:hypothetical protein